MSSLAWALICGALLFALIIVIGLNVDPSPDNIAAFLIAFTVSFVVSSMGSRR